MSNTPAFSSVHPAGLFAEQDICLAQGHNCIFSHRCKCQTETRRWPVLLLNAAPTLLPRARAKVLHRAWAYEANAGVGDVRTSASVETVRGSDRWATAIWGHELQLGKLCCSISVSIGASRSQRAGEGCCSSEGMTIDSSLWDTLAKRRTNPWKQTCMLQAATA